jgi:hypothetical protein
MVVRDANDVGQASLCESITELHCLAVAGVSEYWSQRDAESECLINQVQRDLPLGLELHLVWNPDGATSLAVIGPFLWQIQTLTDHDASEITCQVQARHDLAVVCAAECSRVLPRDTYRVLALLCEAGVVEHDHFETRQLSIHLDRESSLKIDFRPSARRHAVL